MKKFLALSLAVLCLFSLSGCVMVNLGGLGDKIADKLDGATAKGEGRINTEPYAVSDIQEIILSGGRMELVYLQGNTSKLEIQAYENLFNYLEVIDNKGKVTIKASRTFLDNDSVKIFLTAPTLEGIEINGAVDIKEADPIVGTKLELRISGAGSLDLELDVEKLVSVTSGAGNLKLKGSAEDTTMTISGAGAIQAFDLVTKTTEVKITGAGGAFVNCSDDLRVTITGAGGCQYMGEAKVTPSITGVGSIKKKE